jgi:NAD(P)-dependent dehydrogenase (short-subunit alcohol dehydrogenase family)
MRIIITGASGTLGRAVVAAFADRGDRIVAIVRALRQDNGETARQVACADLTDPDATKTAIDKAAGLLGGIDALVCIAGGFDWIPVAQSRPEDWRRLFADNVETTLNAIQAALPVIAEGGSITCVGAASAQPAGAGMAPYAAAKSGVARLVEALAAELKDRRIRVNAVLPAIIDTPPNRAAMPDADPAGWTSPAAIADAIVFLSGPGARAINGGLIPVTSAG